MSRNIVVLKVKRFCGVERKFCYEEIHKEYQFFMVFIFSFALKDNDMPIRGCYFTGSDEKIKFPFEEGMKVVALGKLTNFPVLSNRQIIMKALCY